MTDEQGNKIIQLEEKSLKEYFCLIFERFIFLIAKTLGSRKAAIQSFMNFLACCLIYHLKDEKLRVIVYLIVTIANLVYFQIIKFENIKMEVKLDK